MAGVKCSPGLGQHFFPPCWLLAILDNQLEQLSFDLGSIRVCLLSLVAAQVPAHIPASLVGAELKYLFGV